MCHMFFKLTVVAWQVKSLPAVITSQMCAALVLTAPLLIQLFALVPRRTAQDCSNACFPAERSGKRLLTPCIGQGQLQLCQHLRSGYSGLKASLCPTHSVFLFPPLSSSSALQIILKKKKEDRKIQISRLVFILFGRPGPVSWLLSLIQLSSGVAIA